ncbi:MAG: HDOD domain-containing protein [Thermoguttaceae bacterium]
MNDPASTLDRLVARAGHLYSLPAVAMEVLRLTRNPRVDARALKECLENDPALTGKILRVVNSSLFGLSREVSDLNQALALLGTKPLKLLVLGFSLPTGLFVGLESDVLQRYWRHTLTKAVAGREISETLWQTPGDDAFIAGLLQDLGILLLIQELGEPYVKFLAKVAEGGRDLCPLEVESIGFDHTTLSARLLAEWSLPSTLVDAVGWHSVDDSTSRPEADSSTATQPALPKTLYLAELFAQLLADKRPEVLSTLLEAGREHDDFSRVELETLVGSLEVKVKQLADILSLKLPDGLDYQDVLVQAHSQLSVVAEQAAGDFLRVRSGKAQTEEDAMLVEIQDLADAVAEASRRPATPEAPASTAPASTAPASMAPASTAPASEAPTSAATSGAATATLDRTVVSSEIASGALPADPGLLARVTVSIAACRQSRSALSLLLVRLDNIDELMLTLGLDSIRSLQHLLKTFCEKVDHEGAVCTAHGNDGCALILPDCERRDAVTLGNQLIDKIVRIMSSNGHRPIGISVGVAAVALPPKNFAATELFEGADRCLYGSSASGGGVVKSIEL